MKFFEKIGFFAVVGGNILFDSEKNKMKFYKNYGLKNRK